MSEIRAAIGLAKTQSVHCKDDDMDADNVMDYGTVAWLMEIRATTGWAVEAGDKRVAEEEVTFDTDRSCVGAALSDSNCELLRRPDVRSRSSRVT